jgi:hypothetical protein
MSDDFQLSDEERARLERLKRGLVPSRTEADLIETLRRRGLIRDPRTRWVTAAVLATANRRRARGGASRLPPDC